MVEHLDSRVLPIVTYHGGPLIPHVKLQALYLGSSWQNVPSLKSQALEFDKFGSFIVQSSYMTMLAKAGYRVGTGTSDPGYIDARWVSRTVQLREASIQKIIQQDISAKKLKNPDPSRMYIVYVQPGITVNDGEGTSVHDFYGYHGMFPGKNVSGKGVNIYYAVIAYHSGKNARSPDLSPFNSMTMTASHEIAETTTDPDPTGNPAWYDDDQNGEIADLTDEKVRLGKYIVQKVINKIGQPIAPVGSKPVFTIDVSSLTSAGGPWKPASPFGYRFDLETWFGPVRSRERDAMLA